MRKAQTPAMAWHAVIKSVERETVTKFAELKQSNTSIQLAIGKEKDEARSTSAPSINDPIPTKTTISRGSRLHEEDARQLGIELILKEVQCGRR